jgi:hypothetical protein
MSDEQDPARAYQAQLLALVGDQDPVEVLKGIPSVLREILAEAGEVAREKPAPGEFSLVELVGHMVDAQVVVFTRLRWILAEDAPPIPGYEQDDWVRISDYADADPAQLIDLLEGLERANIHLWLHTPAEQRARVGVHTERGPESFGLTFAMLAGHDLLHLDQARRTLDAVRGGARPAE